MRPRGTRHRFHNVGVHTARMLFLFTPAGPERAFDVVGEPARPGEPAPAPTPLDPERLATMLTVAAELRTELMPEE